MNISKQKKFCFVLMPFDSEFDDIYTLGIKQSCIDAGTYCERVDEQIFNESILDRIYNQISKADIVIADVTNRNPNVFYEVGYAHALGKTTILLTKNADDIPFDLKHYPHIIYDNKIIKIKEELTKKLIWCLENNLQNEPNPLDSLDIFIGDYNKLNIDTFNIPIKPISPARVNFTFFNKSSTPVNLSECKIGFITDISIMHITRITDIDGGKASLFEQIVLPNKKIMHQISLSGTLLPGAYSGLKLEFCFRPTGHRAIPENEKKKGGIFANLPKSLFEYNNIEFNLRFHTPLSNKDFFLNFRFEE